MKLLKQRFALAIITMGFSYVAAASPRCLPDDLDGLYIFSATGYTIVSGVSQPKAIVEFIRFNGDGTLSVPGATRSVNGVIAQSPPGGTGTYAIGDNCMGAVTFNMGPTFDIFVSHDGTDLWMIQTNANNVLQGNVTRLSR
jgi:hypothetical protein